MARRRLSPLFSRGVFTGVESQRKKSLLPLGDLNRLMTVPVKRREVKEDTAGRFA